MDMSNALMKPKKYPIVLINEDKELTSKKVSIVEESEEEEPNFYHKPLENKNLLTANLNLIDVVNRGGNLYFDCPPIVFDTRKKKVTEYYSTVDDYMKPKRPNSPKIVEKKTSFVDRAGRTQTYSKLVEEIEPNRYK